MFRVDDGASVGAWKAAPNVLRQVARSGDRFIFAIGDLDHPDRLFEFDPATLTTSPLTGDPTPWSFLLSRPNFYVGPWVFTPDGQHVLRTSTSWSIELLEVASGLSQWSVPIGGSFFSQSSYSGVPKLIVTDDDSDAVQTFQLSANGVSQQESVLPVRTCGDDCEPLKASMEEGVLLTWRGTTRRTELLDIASRRVLGGCPAREAPSVQFVNRRFFAVSGSERAEIRAFETCRAVWSGKASQLALVGPSRVVAILERELQVLELSGNRARTIFETPVTPDPSLGVDWAYAQPGMLIVDTEVPGRNDVPDRLIRAYDVNRGSEGLLMTRQERCQAFGSEVAVHGPRRMFAFRCDRRTSRLGQPTIFVVRHDGSRLIPMARLTEDVTIGDLSFSSDGRFLLLAEGASQVTVWDVEHPGASPLFSLSLARDGAWMALAPDGRFDTNELEDNRLVSWVMPENPTDPVPVESYLREYYEPQLIAKLAARTPLPQVRPLGSVNRLLPRVAIRSVTAIDADRALVTAEVSESSEVVSRSSGAERRVGTPVEVKLLRNGRLVANAPGDAALSLDPLTRSTTISWTVRLPAAQDGPVVFGIYAFNQELVKSETAIARYARPSRSAQVRRNAFVLSVGVDATNGSGWDLGFAVQDAQQLNRSLRDRLAAFGEFAVDGLTLSARRGADGSVQGDATKAQLKQTLAALAGRSAPIGASDERGLRPLTPDDVLIIQIAAHGVVGNDDQFYLIPSDVGADAHWPRFSPEKAISSRELSEWLHGVDAGALALIIDSCQSEAAIDTGDYKPGPMGNRGLGQLAYDKGMLVLAASQKAQLAREIDVLGHGVLTAALLTRGLEKDDADWEPRDGRIGLREWLAFAPKGVAAVLEQLGNPSAAQQPTLFDFLKRRANRDVVISERRP